VAEVPIASAVELIRTGRSGSILVNTALPPVKVYVPPRQVSVYAPLTGVSNNKSLNTTGASANINRNRNLTANGGIYSLSGSSVIILRSKYLSASGGSYLYSGQSAVLKRSRLLQAIGGSYNLAGSSAILTKSSAGGYPAETDVRLGVVYGASGEYTGTLDVGKKFRLDIATGNVVMILDGGKVMTL